MHDAILFSWRGMSILRQRQNDLWDGANNASQITSISFQMPLLGGIGSTLLYKQFIDFQCETFRAELARLEVAQQLNLQ
jgi:hypothetical protein